MTSACGNPLEPFLKQNGVIVLDGGLTTALPEGLEKHFLWGHQLLYGMDGGLPVLKATYRKFLDGGSDIIATLSYKISGEMLKSLEEKQMLGGIENSHYTIDDLYRASVSTALEARDECWEKIQKKGSKRLKPLVFGSLGPYTDATQLFRGATDPNTRGFGDDEETLIRAYYTQKLTSLKNAGAEGLAIETLSGTREARIACEELEKLQFPGWVSFCCQDGEHTLTGEKLSDCIKAVEHFSCIKAITMNCFNPNLAEAVVKVAKASTNKPVGIYPNSGERWDASEGNRCWLQCDHDHVKYLTGEDAVAFRDAGASMIGGCCRVMPDQIGLFRKALLPENCLGT